MGTNIARIDTSGAATDLRTRYEPQSLEQGYGLAKRIAGTGLVPKPLRGKPDDVFLVMAQGAELGLTTMQALRGLHVIDGRVALSADLMVALCLASPACEYFRCTEQTPQSSTWETLRNGSQPQTMRFSMDDAKRAGLAGRGPWKAYPGRMCAARAKAFLARDVFPDVVGGFHTPDELTAGRQSTFEPEPLPQPVTATATATVEPVRDETPVEEPDEMTARVERTALDLFRAFADVMNHEAHARNALEQVRKQAVGDGPWTKQLLVEAWETCCRKYEGRRARKLEAEDTDERTTRDATPADRLAAVIGVDSDTIRAVNRRLQDDGRQAASDAVETLAELYGAELDSVRGLLYVALHDAPAERLDADAVCTAVGYVRESLEGEDEVEQARRGA